MISSHMPIIWLQQFSIHGLFCFIWTFIPRPHSQWMTWKSQTVTFHRGLNVERTRWLKAWPQLLTAALATRTSFLRSSTPSRLTPSPTLAAHVMSQARWAWWGDDCSVTFLPICVYLSVKVSSTDLVFFFEDLDILRLALSVDTGKCCKGSGWFQTSSPSVLS